MHNGVVTKSASQKFKNIGFERNILLHNTMVHFASLNDIKSTENNNQTYNNNNNNNNKKMST